MSDLIASHYFTAVRMLDSNPRVYIVYQRAQGVGLLDKEVRLYTGNLDLFSSMIKIMSNFSG